MKNSDLPLVTGATVTLELGIDLGDLDRIVQTGCPHSVSSLAQRLGRSGRRNGISEMSFVLEEERHKDGEKWYKTINWLFVKCIALIELYRENWIEPTDIDKYPFSVLYHQTMSFLYSYGEVSPNFLAQTILSLKTFKNITQDDYRELLRYMLEIGHIEKTENGGLLIGQKAEALVNHFEFYTVFETTIEYSVRNKTHEIGTLSEPMPTKTTFVLSGRTWTVTELDKEKKVIYVEDAKGKPPTNWHGLSNSIEHTNVLRKMRDVITNNDSYPYLTAKAISRLNEIRSTIRQTGVLNKDVFIIAPDTYGFFPWLGTKAQNALCFALAAKFPKCVITDREWPLITIKGISQGDLINALKILKSTALALGELTLPKELPHMGKYAEYVPEKLLRKQFENKFIDIDEMQDML